jgi:hypothetical protein
MGEPLIIIIGSPCESLPIDSSFVPIYRPLYKYIGYDTVILVPLYVNHSVLITCHADPSYANIALISPPILKVSLLDTSVSTVPTGGLMAITMKLGVFWSLGSVMVADESNVSIMMVLLVSGLVIV